MHFITWSSSPTVSVSGILFVERTRFRWSTARYDKCPGSHPCRTYDILKEEREGKEDDIGFTASGMKRVSMPVDVVSAKKRFTVFGFPGCEAQNMDRIDKLTNGEGERSYAGAPRPLSARYLRGVDRPA